MEYIDVINEETKLKERLKACEEKYALDVLSMTTRLEELSKHKEDFQNGNSAFAFAREYITVYFPYTILRHFALYIDRLKRELTRDYEQLLTHDLEMYDNAYSGDYHKYTTLVKKNTGISYHQNLGSIKFSSKMPVQYFSDLIMELEKLDITNLKTEEQTVESIDFNPFYRFSDLHHILEFKIKTDEYDYTNLFKLLNFPKEFHVCNADCEKVGMYKLIGDSYVFHRLDCHRQWYNVSDAYKEFLEKNK